MTITPYISGNPRRRGRVVTGWGLVVGLLIASLLAPAPPVSAGPPGTSDTASSGPAAAPSAVESDGRGAEVTSAVVGWATVRTGIGDTAGALSDPRSCGIRLDNTLWCWGDEDANLADGDRVRLELAPRRVATGADWRSVALGSRHGCALDGTGDLWCWGSNNFGQLGDGTETARDELRLVTGPTGWTVIAAAFGQTCGITEDAALWCWGANSAGQLGDGTTTDRAVPTQIGAERGWSDVTAGSGGGFEGRTHGHTCGIATAGTLWCWGDNDYGQLGIGGGPRHKQPVQVGTGTDWASVSAARHATCATKTDGSLWCWGSNAQGRLGDGTSTSRTVPVEIAVGTTWSSVALGSWHTCGIQLDGTAWCWGRNTDGTLGDGTTARRLVPTAVLGDLTWAEMSLSDRTTCGVTADRTAICWGDGSFGQRDTGNLDRALAPTINDRVRGEVGPWLSRWTTLAGGEGLRCGILKDSRAACWSAQPVVDVPSGGAYAQSTHDVWSWLSVSVGDRWMCGFRSDHAVVCVGEVKGETEPFEPVDPAGGTWAGVETGDYHACAWKADASLWCWGNNFYGQLGTGDKTSQPFPVQLAGSWRAVSGGDSHTCGIQTDGSLWCWGHNSVGQLGLGFESASELVPMRVGDRTDWADVSVGQFSTCGLTTDHTAYCWGANNTGQLGDGTTEHRSSPVAVVGPADWQDVVVDGQNGHTCGLRMDRTAWCWGRNGGQLGTGGTEGSSVPVPVTGGHQFKTIMTFYGGGCAVAAGKGRAWCWGEFDGDGTKIDHLSPTRVRSVRDL